jgi:hypothetical protein
LRVGAAGFFFDGDVAGFCVLVVGFFAAGLVAGSAAATLTGRHATRNAAARVMARRRQASMGGDSTRRS